MPNEIPFLIDSDKQQKEKRKNNKYDIQMIESPFSLRISNKQNNETVFDSSVGDLIFSETYVQISSSFNRENRLFGLGERFASFELNRTQKYSIWSTDNGQREGKTGDYPTYGNQHILMNVNRKRQNNYIILLRTSSGSEVDL